MTSLFLMTERNKQVAGFSQPSSHDFTLYSLTAVLSTNLPMCSKPRIPRNHSMPRAHNKLAHARTRSPHASNAESTHCTPTSRYTIRGHVHMTSAKFSGFWTPSLPLSVPNSRNLPSFGQKLANPLPPVSADVICTSSLRGHP